VTDSAPDGAIADAIADDRDGPPRAVLVAALVVAVGAVLTILVVAATRQVTPAPKPVAIAAAPAPQADGDACRALMKVLPDAMGDYHRAAAVAPVPAGAAAWQAGPDGDPVIIRCGLDRPDDFVVSSPLQGVDDVQWFRIPGDGRTTWVTVDRSAYVALTLPDGSGPEPIQLISKAVAQVMPATPLDPGPLR
jgi:hypothetical protein